jgi:ribosomal protein L29
MEKEISGIREMMKEELELVRENRRQELLAMRVSPPTQVQI